VSFARRHRFITVLFALWAMLWTQFAVAAHDCTVAAQAAQVAQMAEAGMPCAQAMAGAADEGQPALCHAHCRADSPTPDLTQLPTIGALADVDALVVPVVDWPARAEHRIQSTLLRPDGGPPLAVRHCCFRI
jgi:hypothetical protein